VERFRFPPEERDKVRRAAELGNPFGQYLWGLVCHYDLGEPLQAWDWFSRSAAHGYHDSVRHQALLMETGLIPLKGSSRNPETHALQIRAAAAKLYLKAAELGNYQAKFQYALCCLEGRGRAVNFREAAHWLLESACQGHKPAQERLAALCLDPAISAYDPFEACVWASVAATPETAGIFAALGSLLSPAGIDAAQAEAVRRSALIAENGRLSPEDLEAFERPLSTPRKRSAAPARDAKKLAELQQWRLNDSKNLKLAYFLDSGKITFHYGNKKLTIPAVNILPERCLALLRIYFDHRAGIQSLDYHGLNIAAESGCRRQNHTIVDDFNHEFRKLFGLERRFRAFRWIGKGRGKSLHANIGIDLR